MSEDKFELGRKGRLATAAYPKAKGQDALQTFRVFVQSRWCPARPVGRLAKGEKNDPREHERNLTASCCSWIGSDVAAGRYCSRSGLPMRRTSTSQ